MAYLAALLINRAWNLSGIVARGLETVSGAQGDDGLFLLNELLEFESADTNLIPYYRRYSGVFVQGQEDYDITGLLQVQAMTFTMDNQVRYPMTYVSREKYYGSGRVNNIQSIPFIYHYERQLNGSKVSVYYLPMAAYTFQISGKFGLSDVTLTTDLSATYDGFYIGYLRYMLAAKMCQEYSLDFGMENQKALDKIIKKLQWVSPPDLSLDKVSFISNKSPLDWQQINIGKGFIPN